MMGIPIRDLYEMTEYEFNLYRIGYQKREIAAWERSRYEAWVAVCVQSSKPPQIEEMLPLPTDQERKVEKSKLRKSKKVSKQEFINIAERLGLKDKVWQAQ